MAQTIYLPDGTTEIMFGRDSFQKLVAERLGYDAEKILQEIIDEADYTKAKVQTDLVSYESSLEDNTSCFQEILAKIEKIQRNINSKRMSKDKILELLSNIEAEIHNQI